MSRWDLPSGPEVADRRGRGWGGRDPLRAAHGAGGVGVPDGERDQGGDGDHCGGGEEGVVEAGISAAPVAPAGLAEETTVTSAARPIPPATRPWVWNSAEARPVSAEEMVANDEVWTAMLHQAIEDPLQKISSRISQMLVSSPMSARAGRRRSLRRIARRRPSAAARCGDTRARRSGR